MKKIIFGLSLMISFFFIDSNATQFDHATIYSVGEACKQNNQLLVIKDDTIFCKDNIDCSATPIIILIICCMFIVIIIKILE
jgi:hypothetical protein